MRKKLHEAAPEATCPFPRSSRHSSQPRATEKAAHARARASLDSQPADGRAHPTRPGAPLRQPNPLEQYFDSHLEGPGIWKPRHYFEIYHRHFAKFVGREINVLEIGVYSGGSLGMWKEYFGPGCRIYGVDIAEDCRCYEDERTTILVGDQSDRAFWRAFAPKSRLSTS